MPLGLSGRKLGWLVMVEVVKKITGEILKQQGVGIGRVTLWLKGIGRLLAGEDQIRSICQFHHSHVYPDKFQVDRRFHVEKKIHRSTE